MICEGSWDTEDWSIDAENSALDLSKKNILKYILIYVFFVYNLSIYVSYKPTF